MNRDDIIKGRETTQPEALRLADEMERVAEYDHQVQAAAELRRLYKLKHPRQWQGLTDEDVDEVERWIEFKEDGSGRIPTQKLVRYIEAKLKAKNS